MPEGERRAHAHESPAVMVVPLALLAVPAALAGWAGRGFFASYLGHTEAAAEAGPDVGLMLASTALALLGVALAWACYGARWLSAERLTSALRPVHRLLEQKYYVDHAYDWLVGRAFIGLASGLAWLDRRGVDGAVNGLARATRDGLGWAVGRTESGRVPNYALGIFAGVVVIAAALVYSLPGAAR